MQFPHARIMNRAVDLGEDSGTDGNADRDDVRMATINLGSSDIEDHNSDIVVLSESAFMRSVARHCAQGLESDANKEYLQEARIGQLAALTNNMDSKRRTMKLLHSREEIELSQRQSEHEQALMARLDNEPVQLSI